MDDTLSTYLVLSPQKKCVFASVFHPRVHLQKTQWTRSKKHTLQKHTPSTLPRCTSSASIARVVATKSWLRTMIFLPIVLRMMAHHHPPCLLCLHHSWLMLRRVKKSSTPPILRNTTTRMGFLRTKWQDASSAQIMDTWQKWVSIFIFFAYGRGYTHGRKADENTRVKLDKCASVRLPMDNA